MREGLQRQESLVRGSESGRASGHLHPTQSRGTDLGQNIPCRKMGSSGWKFLLLLGWTKKQKSSHRDPERNGADVAGDRHRACVWGQGRQRACVRFRIQRQKQSQGEGGITVTEQKTQSEPHNPDPDRAPETEVPGERWVTQEEGGRRGLPGGVRDKGHRDGEKAWGPWAAAACLDTGGSLRGPCGLPHQGRRGSPTQGAGGSLAPYSSARVRKSGPQSSSGSAGPGAPPASEPRELSEPQDEPRPS